MACTLACRPAADPAAPGPVDAAVPAESEAELDLIALGSCLDQRRDLAILDRIREDRPDLFVFMGDNVYADATDARALERAYGILGEHPSYRALREAVPVLAMWDDHDYGLDDAGAENPIKAASKRVMLDFFGVPEGAPRRAREGNYDAVVLGPEGRRVQIVLLDTRWFRDPLLREGDDADAPYRPREGALLGEAQWRWLEATLRVPAQLRLVVSGIQVLPDEHPFERWALFPAERERLFTLLERTGADRVVFASGDRHRGELSCASHPAVGFPLYELTSSSLNRPSRGRERNRFRLPGTPLVDDANYGRIQIDWSEERVHLELFDDRGQVRVRHAVALDHLEPGAGSSCPSLAPHSATPAPASGG